MKQHPARDFPHLNSSTEAQACSNSLADVRENHDPDGSFRGRVLLVDDSRENQRILTYHLEKLGLEVVVANDGLEGVERGSSGRFDLILMDVQMPVIDGLVATELLRILGIREPIVAFSAVEGETIVDKCLSAGCDGFLQKPIEFEKLAVELSRYIAIRPHSLTGESMIGHEIPPSASREDLQSLDLRDRIGVLRDRVMGLQTALSRESAANPIERGTSPMTNTFNVHTSIPTDHAMGRLTGLISDLESILEETACLLLQKSN